MTGKTDFIVCYGALRSGSTLLRLMVNAHPALSCPGEVDFLFDYLHRDPDTGEWRYKRGRFDNDRIFRASGLRLPDQLDGVDALEDMIGQIRVQGGGLPVLMLHRHFDRVADIFPDCRVVRLKRDPRDVARSCVGMGWAGNVYCGLDRWLWTEHFWRAGAPRMHTPPHETRYEDLIMEPETTLREFCEYVGVAYDPAMLSYHTESTYAAPDPSLVRQWRRKLSPVEIGLLEGRLGDLLTEHGYETSGHAPLRPGRIGRARLVAQSKLSEWWTLARRFGVITVLQRAVARRLRLEAMRRAAQDRIDEITSASLK